MNDLAKETEAILSLQERALNCTDLDNLARDVLEPTAELLNAATGCFLQLSDDGEGRVQFGRTAAYNVPQSAHNGYLAHHFREDPAIEAATTHSGRLPFVFRTSDIYDYAKLTVSPFYNDFFRPNRIHHVMVMAQRPQGSDRDILLLGFHRPSTDRPFDESEKRRLQRVASALGCAVRVLCLQDDLALRNQAISEIDAEFPTHGLLFFDEHMSLVYGNETGLDHLQLGARGAQARLEQLSRACRRAERAGEDSEAVTTDFSESEDVVAKIRARRNQGGRLMFAVHTNRRMTEAVFATRCREYDFSPREVDITRALAAGLCNAEIAERLFISVRTVENHLRSIYSKAGVHRRTQLLSRLNDFE